jgi:hypothetical protein
MAQQMPLVDDNSRVVEVSAAKLIEAHDKGRLKLRSLIQQLHDLRRIDGERISASDLSVIRISRQKTFRETDDVDSIRIRLLQSFQNLPEIRLKITEPRV